MIFRNYLIRNYLVTDRDLAFNYVLHNYLSASFYLFQSGQAGVLYLRDLQMYKNASGIIRLISVGVIIFLSSCLWAQNGEIIPLSQKVGTVLDAEENLFYQVYDIDGFESAQFYEISLRTVVAKITFVEYSQQKISKRKYSMMEFLRMKEAVDVQPWITEEDRKLVKENLTYLETNNILNSIRENQYVVIKHRSGRKIRGTLINYDDKELIIQTAISVEKIPIWDMESISYRESFKIRSDWKYPLFAFSALAGLALAEGWNEQTRPAIDSVWYNRFLGSVAGMLAGIEVFQTFNILTSPKTFFALTPEEMDRLRD
jgi:small nuclear ribonucleoprotein (snRNP)-like protein